ncbi:unnamed protein product [Lymnaea stagnalis]|uniref:Uncharacterized protein n=1 Tax=Lymnaea stagnalis TaxID=6523 RepID=A0AAV2I8I5_LYMST
MDDSGGVEDFSDDPDMKLVEKETTPPPVGTRKSPRNCRPVVTRRSRLNSNDSENSSESSKSTGSHSTNPATSSAAPGSAGSSRVQSFRGEKPLSRRSPAVNRHGQQQQQRTSSNGRVSGNDSITNISNATVASIGGDRTGDQPEIFGPRRRSMPNVTENFLQVPSAEDTKDNRLRRVRSFKTTSKGLIVNRGDSFKKKSTHSLMSTGSAITDARSQQLQQQHTNNLNNNVSTPDAPPTPTYYRVILMGAAGCGKSLMAKQFMTSDYVGGNDDNHEAHENSVSVLLDGEESTIEFIDPLDRNVIEEGLQHLLDAYVVVFAINDHASFEQAQQLVRYLRVDHGTDRAIVLVANKIDLVRKRKVTADEARLVAETYDCKYSEISAALNHHVDELLVGILTQIRLHMRIPFTTISFPGKESKQQDPNRREKRRPLKGPRGFFSRLFRRSSNKKPKPCENLYTL